MNTWIITASNCEIGAILKAAGTDAKLFVCGTPEIAANFTQAPVAEIFHLDPHDTPAEAFAPAIAKFLQEKGATTILAANFATERALATAAAAKIDATWISGAISWDRTTRKAVRNVAAMALETVEISGAAALTLPAGTGTAAGNPASDSSAQAGNPTFTTIEIAAADSVSIANETPLTTDHIDLSKAERVIGVGRGVAEIADLAMIRELATKIDAQLGGTRPLAEGSGWFDSYIGLTGQQVAAELYLAIGTSGQIHHAGGVRESNIIAAICDDPQAPIFQEADYGIVGDLYELVPQIMTALSE
ncbi:electron transfer flavoprotein subunit alpha/FixB family protein [Arcanobacterium hippocoleae]|uniref:Electron transfer flavoprotein alpha subunit n=1 Tax=Arcanobacterium hippocoleae TaxID=149017 RepID=A0ABU1T478_9ACTO|nr:electron transfer flavoprotein subunit alpha/FixB family protein [Arcanobacterium hippocoleae]MDR6939645.1 electron transfer flavoprotein alpha subunit [Arcanobacterium hippocoleae]